MKPYIGVYIAANENQATLIAIFCTEHAQFTQAMAGWEYVDLAAHLKAMIDNQDDQTHYVREFDSLDQVMEMIDTSDDEITIFKSNGIALEDIATALRLYNLARERGIGESIDLWKRLDS